MIKVSCTKNLCNSINPYEKLSSGNSTSSTIQILEIENNTASKFSTDFSVPGRVLQYIVRNGAERKRETVFGRKLFAVYKS